MKGLIMAARNKNINFGKVKVKMTVVIGKLLAKGDAKWKEG